MGEKPPNNMILLLDESDDGFAEVLRDVLSVVFYFPDVYFLPWF
jgi:hypothetical protein